MIAFAIWLVLAAAGDLPPAPSPPVATAGFVAVAAPAPDDRLLEESSSRVRSELAASGLDSRFVDCPRDAGGQPKDCASPDALATIVLAREDGLVAIRVHAVLPDGLELSRVVRVRTAEGSDDPAVLAIRAVELLRDVRLDMARSPPSPPPALRRSGSRARDDEDPASFTIAPPPELPAPTWWLSVGPAMLASAARGQPGLGPSIGVALGLDVGLLPRLSAIVTLAGPFNRALGPYDLGQATLLQALAQIGLRYQFDVARLHPFAEVFVGVDYLSASITQRAVGSGSASTSVPLGGAGGGLSADFLRRFRATLEGSVFTTEPQISTTVAARNLGRAGAPSFLVIASVGVGFP